MLSNGTIKYKNFKRFLIHDMFWRNDIPTGGKFLNKKYSNLYS